MHLIFTYDPIGLVLIFPTENEDWFNYFIGIIASIFGYSSNDGDSGDSSTDSSLPADSVGSSLPGDSGIDNREGNSWFYSLMSKFLCVIDKIILKQLHDFCGTSIEYIISLINHVFDILGYITTWSINHWSVYLAEISLYCLIHYIRYVIAQIKAENQTVYTILFNISACNFARVSQIENGLENSNRWNDLQEVNNTWN